MEDREAVQEKVMTAAAMMPDESMEEPMPDPAEPVAILTGSFMDADRFHQGSGDAKVFRLPDGRTILRFENFNVTNGPALSVLLSSNPTPAAGRRPGGLRRPGAAEGEYREPELRDHGLDQRGRLQERDHLLRSVPRDLLDRDAGAALARKSAASG